MKTIRFVVYKDTADEYRWTLVAANGERISDSAESYVRRIDCLAGIDLVRIASRAPVRAGRKRP